MGVIFNQVVEIATPRVVRSPYSTQPVTVAGSDWVDCGVLCSVQPDGASSEGPVERPQLRNSLVLISPPGSDIPALTAGVKVRVGGTMVCDVVGSPARWPDPYTPGVIHHVEAILEVVSG